MWKKRALLSTAIFALGACSSGEITPGLSTDAAMILGDGGVLGDGSAIVGDASVSPTADLSIPSTAGCKYTANKTGLSAFQQAGGLAFHVYAPSNYSASVSHTVVVIMHGQDSDGTGELNALWKSIADSEQLVLLAPKGSLAATDPGTYPTGANWSVNDLNHIQDLTSQIDDCYNTNTKKHILWGFSEGCFYGYLLGIGAANQFSGLAMGGANTSFARQNGYAPANEQWKIPVSHVQGTTDQNGEAQSVQDKSDFMAAGSVFTLYQPVQGHTITGAQVLQQYNDLKNSSSP